MSVFGIDIPLNQLCLLPEGLKKENALESLVDAVAMSPNITNRDLLCQAVYDRELAMSTGIGGGIAIPHVRIKQVLKPTLGVAVSRQGIAFGTLDNKPVHVLVLFATPEGADSEYLGLLAQVMVAMRGKELYNRLLVCTTREEMYQVLCGG
jgi:mannitol/fructose-specific phosphotransferase system IIA component (Ntr-type)